MTYHAQRSRAETRYKATDTETIPVLIAEHIDQERQETDEPAGVFIIPVTESQISRFGW